MSVAALLPDPKRLRLEYIVPAADVIVYSQPPRAATKVRCIVAPFQEPMPPQFTTLLCSERSYRHEETSLQPRQCLTRPVTPRLCEADRQWFALLATYQRCVNASAHEPPW